LPYFTSITAWPVIEEDAFDLPRLNGRGVRLGIDVAADV
jgi:hypothetical protein